MLLVCSKFVKRTGMLEAEHPHFQSPSHLKHFLVGLQCATCYHGTCTVKCTAREDIGVSRQKRGLQLNGAIFPGAQDWRGTNVTAPWKDTKGTIGRGEKGKIGKFGTFLRMARTALFAYKYVVNSQVLCGALKFLLL